jgi:hypothetical protein
MKTPLLEELRQHLAAISSEEFQKEWSEITNQEFEGPTVEEFLHAISYGINVSEIKDIQLSNNNFNSNIIIKASGESNYSIAA